MRLFVTCLGDTLFPSTGQALVRLLERLGHGRRAPGAVPEAVEKLEALHVVVVA